MQRMRPRKKPIGKFVISFVALAFFLSAGAVIAGNTVNTMLKPVDPGQGVDKELIVPKGSNTRNIAETLDAQGLIQNQLVFRLYVKYKGQDNKLKAGEYNLNTGLSVQEIVARLVKGETFSYSFTIPEGFSLKQIADKLEEKKLIDRNRFMELASGGKFDYEFLQGLPEGPDRLEGYLFPDTYQVTNKTTEEQIIKMMLSRFDKEIKKYDFRAKAQEHGLSVHQAVILASIIEREAKKDEERPKVAAVFLNRLKKGWKLESCATIQYLLGEPRERLFAKDLAIESPYNTYKYTGLPPGPVASPGGPSLKAAVNPADVDYMFFVVSEDGKHVFSRTLQEHNKNKAVYLDRLKESR